MYVYTWSARLYILFSFIARPIGFYYGIKDGRPKKAPANPVFEKSYRSKKFPTEDELQVYGIVCE